MWQQFAEIHTFASNHWSYWAFAIGFFMWLLYLLVTGPFRKWFADSKAPSIPQHLYMALGMLTYFLAFASPLDYISDRFLFSAHMVQHMLEVSVMVPLLLKSLPDWLWTWAFSWAPFKKLFGVLVNPFVALIVFMLIFDNFHWPVLYDLTLTNPAFHVTEHLLFFFTATFLWWPALSTHPTYPRIAQHGLRILYLFVAFDVMMPPAILILMWNHPLYYPYTEAPVRLFGLSPVSDQQLGSVIMLVFGAISNGIAAIGAFRHWEWNQWYE